VACGACLEVSISLRVIRTTSFDAGFMGCGWMMSCMPIILPFVCVCVCVVCAYVCIGCVLTDGFICNPVTLYIVCV